MWCKRKVPGEILAHLHVCVIRTSLTSLEYENCYGLEFTKHKVILHFFHEMHQTSPSSVTLDVYVHKSSLTLTLSS